MIQVTRKHYAKRDKEIIYLGTHTYTYDNRNFQYFMDSENSIEILFKIDDRIICYKTEDSNFMSVIYLEEI